MARPDEKIFVYRWRNTSISRQDRVRTNVEGKTGRKIGLRFARPEGPERRITKSVAALVFGYEKLVALRGHYPETKVTINSGKLDTLMFYGAIIDTWLCRALSAKGEERWPSSEEAETLIKPVKDYLYFSR